MTTCTIKQVSLVKTLEVWKQGTETLLFAAVSTARHRHGAEQELQTLQTQTVRQPNDWV